ncbi:MAG: deoxynucleoside kinase [Candidatus Micrarchaeota archaeon]
MYISISGVHGIGKSTLCRLLARRNGWQYSPEVLDTMIPPPRLGPKSPERLLGELWHMRQLILREEEIKKYNNSVLITDRWWHDLIIYGKSLLSEKEFRIFEDIITAVPKETPDLEIVLWATPEALVERIKNRRRTTMTKWGEDDEEYLNKVNEEFKKYYENFKEMRTIVLLEATGCVEDIYDSARKIIRTHIADTKQRSLKEFNCSKD